MCRELLEQFFGENSVQGDSPSAPALAHFTIKMHGNPKGSGALDRMLNENVYQFAPGRKEEALADKAAIEVAASCDKIIRLMRRHSDPINHVFFAEKAMAFEDELVPELVRRLKTSLNDGFIEAATRILARSKLELYNMGTLLLCSARYRKNFPVQSTEKSARFHTTVLRAFLHSVRLAHLRIRGHKSGRNIFRQYVRRRRKGIYHNERRI